MRVMLPLYCAKPIADNYGTMADSPQYPTGPGRSWNAVVEHRVPKDINGTFTRAFVVLDIVHYKRVSCRYIYHTFSFRMRQVEPPSSVHRKKLLLVLDPSSDRENEKYVE